MLLTEDLEARVGPALELARERRVLRVATILIVLAWAVDGRHAVDDGRDERERALDGLVEVELGVVFFSPFRVLEHLRANSLHRRVDGVFGHRNARRTRP